MAHRRRNRECEEICSLASMRAGVAWKTASALMAGATNRQLMRASRRILSACDGEDRSMKISTAQLQELVMPNWQCVDQTCPACFFWEPMSRAINEFFRDE
jgi:hypothetical protein